MVYSIYSEIDARIKDAWYIEPHGFLGQDNIKRIKEILSEEDWEFLFPLRNEQYDYYDFLYAAASYPAFCNSRVLEDSTSYEELCKRELSTILAHMIEDTNLNDQFDNVDFWR